MVFYSFVGMMDSGSICGTHTHILSYNPKEKKKRNEISHSKIYIDNKELNMVIQPTNQPTNKKKESNINVCLYLPKKQGNNRSKLSLSLTLYF